MIERLPESTATVFAYKVTGKVTRDEYDQVRAELEHAIAEHGSVRALIDATDWTGVEPSVLWEDLKFSTKHLNDFARMALVGNKKWERWAAKASDYITKGEVRFFDSAQRGEALAWIAA
ncbi:hypothetical protein BH23BAC4_BH23BAC4_16540 [soil metagenome]